VGDKIDYVLTSKVPTMDGYNKYFFIINDTMSEGLTFNNDVVVKIGSKTLVEGTDYTVEITNNADGTTSFQIIFKNFIQYKAVAGTAIEVTYSATLNEKAKIGEEGNPNTANLTFSNNPNVDGKGDDENPDKPGPKEDDVIGETPDDTVITYTSGIKLKKVDAEGKSLTGAKFKIEGVAEKVVIINENIFTKSENGTYYRLTDGTYTEEEPNDLTKKNYESTSVKYELITVVNKTTEKTNIVTEAWVDENGIITFEGLGEGTFTITEMEAPEGYNKLTNPITIVISFNKNGTPKWTATQNGNPMELEGNLFAFEVVNKAGATLPTTGGMGTTLFYVVGAVLVMAAVVLLITKKRVANEG
jgi:fimbrial isopeptide formation D2 family protein/LPXTG-motif cell wall-anchored protein